ncbi:MAG: hypothetical protein ACE5EM_06910 [Sphingomonadales bacterium]
MILLAVALVTGPAASGLAAAGTPHGYMDAPCHHGKAMAADMAPYDLPHCDQDGAHSPSDKNSDCGIGHEDCGALCSITCAVSSFAVNLDAAPFREALSPMTFGVARPFAVNGGSVDLFTPPPRA